MKKAVDSIQQRITDYACDLSYDSLPSQAIQAAKVRIIDILGALIGGFFGEPCRIARNLAARMPNTDGATVIGTRMKTTPDMAAFVNAITARHVEMMDVYHWPGSSHGHPSDTITPVLAAAEYAQVSGRELIAAVVLAYEVFCRISDVVHSKGFDNTNFGCIGSAVGAGKALGLTPDQLSHCIAMAVVPNNILKQAVKTAAAGQAGRAGVFAAMLARAGMEGPHLPFEGKAGWCEHVARERFTLDAMGNKDTRFKILDTQLKNRPAGGAAIACILAAEKVAPLNIKNVSKVTVEVYKFAKERTASDHLAWHPDSREKADCSAPYLVAATLMDGTISLRSYNDAHLHNPALHELMQKIEIVENPEFTQAFMRLPVEHRARVNVVTHSGERMVGETGGDQDDMSAPMSDTQIVQKFRALTEGILGAKQVNVILDRLWNLDEMENVAEMPTAFVI